MVEHRKRNRDVDGKPRRVVGEKRRQRRISDQKHVEITRQILVTGGRLAKAMIAIPISIHTPERPEGLTFVKKTIFLSSIKRIVAPNLHEISDFMDRRHGLALVQDAPTLR